MAFNFTCGQVSWNLNYYFDFIKNVLNANLYFQFDDAFSAKRFGNWAENSRLSRRFRRLAKVSTSDGIQNGSRKWTIPVNSSPTTIATSYPKRRICRKKNHLDILLLASGTSSSNVPTDVLIRSNFVTKTSVDPLNVSYYPTQQIQFLTIIFLN